MQTRICVQNSVQKGHVIPVYAIDRSALEAVGDLLPIEDEVR